MNDWGDYSFKLEKQMSKSIGFIDTNLGLDHVLACVGELDVRYYIASGGAYPYLKDERSGDGFPITKVDHMIDATSCDVVAFLDCYFGKDADVLREQGKAVYGPSEYWTRIENDRRFGWRELQKMGIGVPDGVIVQGVLGVLDYIRRHQDGKRVFYIKNSKYRGSKETGSGVTNWLEAYVALAAGAFGPYAEDMEFLIQEKCSGQEFGCDVYVNGRDIIYPYLLTVEEKGSGTVGKWVYATILDEILLNKILPSVRGEGVDDRGQPIGEYRGMICFEFFIDEKGRIQVHDPCARNSYPCSAIQAHTIANYPELICKVAAGEDVKIETNGDEYVAQVGLYTDDKDTPRTIRFDEELRPFVGFRRVVRKAGDYWYLPGDFLVATSVVSGNTPEWVIDRATEVAGKIECSNSSIPGRFKEDVMKKIEILNGWDMGLRF
jgi:hypothetical protein